MALSQNKEKRERQLANLKPARKGEPSRNPGGRPSFKSFTAAIRGKLSLPIPNDRLGRTYAEALADSAIGHALAGKHAYLNEILDRAEGRAPLQLQHSADVYLSVEQQAVSARAKLFAMLCPEAEPDKKR